MRQLLVQLKIVAVALWRLIRKSIKSKSKVSES